MPEISDLILTIVKPLIVHDDKMSIEIKETSEFMEYHLHLDAEDVGRVIGKRDVSPERSVQLYTVSNQRHKTCPPCDRRGRIICSNCGFGRFRSVDA